MLILQLSFLLEFAWAVYLLLIRLLIIRVLIFAHGNQVNGTDVYKY